MNKNECYELRERTGFEVRRAYSDWLKSQTWDYFITVTFRNPRRDSIKVSESVWSELSYLHARKAFLAVERHRYPNWNCHVHGLVQGYDPDWYPKMPLPWEVWGNLYKKFGRSTVEVIKHPEQVSSYCAKYVTKKMSNYGVYGSPMFWQPGDLTNSQKSFKV